jgi:nucleoside-diphosphate-sugar epimerase
MKKVLVTGASGFIGRHCLPLLLSRGYEVHALARQRSANSDSSDIHWHEIDLLTPGSCAQLLSRLQPECLLHLAWYAVPGKFWEATENIEWVRASMELLQAFAENGGTRVVVAGTCAEYDWSEGECNEDTTPLLPSTLYGTSKHSLERLVNDWSRQQTISAAWGRVFFLYGPDENPSRLVAYVIRSLLQNQPALCTDGRQLKDFLHVHDVASAFVSILESQVVGPVNIGSGIPIAIRDVLSEIGRYIGRPDLLVLGARSSAGEPAAIWANIEKLTKQVLWVPRYDLKRGLEQTIEWWRRSPDVG